MDFSLAISAKRAARALIPLTCAPWVACNDSSAPVQPEPKRASSTVVSEQPARWHRTSDDEFEYLETRIPGFGGYYLNAAGQLEGYLTDPAKASSAKRILIEELAGRTFRTRFGRADVSLLSFKPARYSFSQLRKWRQAVNSLASSIPGLASTDVDQVQNRVRVGVADAAAAANWREALKALLPDAALEIAVVGMPTNLLMLTDRAPVKQGGFEIQFVKSTDPGNVRRCTLGFNARRHGYTAQYFVTNSHCTSIFLGPDGTQFYQNLYQQPDFVGSEAVDPPYFTNASDPLCPAGLMCRFSDAALVEYPQFLPVDQGYLARTQFAHPTNGSKTIDNTYSSFPISGYAMYPTVGSAAEKIGRSTGWTYGDVTYDCVDLPSGTLGYWMICQSVATMGSTSGDSGSPVFVAENFDTGPVSLLGILWGASSTDGSFFSPMAGIAEDLGGQLIVR
ncbi:MAG: hypothetical protein WKF55_08255 [Gemmatimonadaceae bacterium]